MKQKWKIWGLTLLLIIVSRESFWFGTYGNASLYTTFDLFLMVLPVAFILTHVSYRFSYRSVGLLFFSILMFVFTTVLHGNSMGGPLLMISSFLSAFYISKLVKMEVYLGVFSEIITLLSLCSIIVWGGCLIDVVTPVVGYNVVGAPVLHKFFSVLFMNEESMLLRNSSIFREPGVFMVYLGLSLIVELIYLPRVRKKYNVIHIIILLVALLSTFSTGGIVTGVLILLLVILSQRKINLSVFIFSILLAIGISFFMNDEYIFLSIFGKFDNIDSSGSGFTRLASFVLPLYIIFRYPIFGAGYEDYYILFDKYCRDIFLRSIDAHQQSTNTFMTFGAIWGVWALILFVVGIYLFSKRLCDINLVQKGIFIAILLMLCNEAMLYSIPLYIIIFYGLSSNKFEVNPYPRI